MDSIRTLTVVTPARNERDNLRRLGKALIAQTWRPRHWIVVDNGSTDGTADVVRALAAEHDWIRLLAVEPPERPIRGPASVRAFNAGATFVDSPSDLITNADADVSFDPEYFARLRDEFEARPKLGIASGLCYERQGETWKPVHVAPPNLRGASFTYRRECFVQLTPVEERVGWDGIEVVRAGLRGWETATIATLAYRHHRATGARDSSRFSGWVEEGATAHYMWYRPLYLLLRATHRIVADRDLAATGLVWGYTRSAARRDPRQAEPGFRELVHDRQSLRNVTARLRRGQAGSALAGLADGTIDDTASAHPSRAEHV